VFARTSDPIRGEAAARGFPRDHGAMPQGLAQDRANRSKKLKVIYRQIDIFEPARFAAGLADDPRIRPHIGIRRVDLRARR
jgi:hypothetical protein